MKVKKSLEKKPGQALDVKILTRLSEHCYRLITTKLTKPLFYYGRKMRLHFLHSPHPYGLRKPWDWQAR